MTVKASRDARTGAAPHQGSGPDLVLVSGAVIIIGLVVMALLLWPEQAQSGARLLFDGCTRIIGAPVQLLGFACALMAGTLAASRFGDIRLGDGEPQYGTASWLFMFISAGLGSATMYWAFMEWAYYYTTPGLDMIPRSREALDQSVAYAFFHWGPIPWSMYVIAGVAMAYHVHVRSGGRLSYAGNISAVIPRMCANGFWGRVIDIVFLFATFGGLILTITVTVNTASAGVARLAAIQDAFWLKAVILFLSTLAFGASSYIGIGKGLQRLARLAIGASFAFAAVVLLTGPTEFIASNLTNALGLELQNFVHMALFTDPNGGGSFSRDWTVFYWLYWLSYLPGVAIFIARVSKGRTIRQTVLGLVVGGCAGIVFFFGVLSSFAIYQTTHGIVDAPRLLAEKGGEFAVSQILFSLPLGAVFATGYYLITLLFLASHLDATAYTIATVTTRNLAHGQDPARPLRLFWVLMLAAIPMAMLAINANLSTLKTGLTLTSIPFLVLLVIQIVGLIGWLREDRRWIDPHSGLVRLPGVSSAGIQGD